MLPVALAWYSSDGVAICYVLPVLTSSFHNMGPTVRIEHDDMFKRNSPRRYQLDVRQLQRLVEFIRTWHLGKVCYLQLTT